jgi:hypothetical protein
VTDQTVFDRLAEPFPADAVSWRVGSTTQDKAKGMALAYLDARDVMERLDYVCGPAGWQCDYPHANGKTVCRIGIKAGEEWIWKADGAGDTDVEAEKGALSDAFKRAAVRWGIGRYLYALPSPWVEIEPMGRSFRIKQSQHAKLRELLNNFTGGPVKSSAAAKRDGDFDHFKAKLDAAETMEELGAIGREIKTALPLMPAAMREPLQDAYLLRREALQAAEPGAETDEAFRQTMGGPRAGAVAGNGSPVAAQ